MSLGQWLGRSATACLPGEGKENKRQQWQRGESRGRTVWHDRAGMCLPKTKRTQSKVRRSELTQDNRLGGAGMLAGHAAWLRSTRLNRARRPCQPLCGGTAPALTPPPHESRRLEGTSRPGTKGSGVKRGQRDVTLSRWAQRVEKRKAILCLGSTQLGLVGTLVRPTNPGLKNQSPKDPNQ